MRRCARQRERDGDDGETVATLDLYCIYRARVRWIQYGVRVCGCEGWLIRTGMDQ